MKLREGWLVLGSAVVLCIAGVALGQAPAAPATQAPGGAENAQGGGRGGRGGRGAAAGPAPAYPQHAQADPATIARGQQIFSTNCSFCHGSDARGGEGGPNLLRSQIVLDDQNGEGIGVVVQNGRPDLGMPKFDLSNAQVSDIAGYLHSLNVSSRGRGAVEPNILVGDAKAGEAYFNGPGKCNTCHSVTGDLAAVGSKMDPKTLQNALVSGGGGRGRGPAPADDSAANGRTVTVKVTPANGKAVEGKLDHLDDFEVSLTEADGTHVSFARNGDVPKVDVHNPLQAHLDMLKTYTDDEIHNLTAYLVTLK